MVPDGSGIRKSKELALPPSEPSLFYLLDCRAPDRSVEVENPGFLFFAAFLVLSRDRICRRPLLEGMDALFLGKDPILGLYPGSSFWR